MNGMSIRRKIFASLAVVALMGVAAFGTFAAFTATSVNSGNQIETGTVEINDDSGATTQLYDVSNQKPGDATAACLRIKYDGSLDASVKMFLSGAVSNGDMYTLKVERGSGLTTIDGTRSCAGFVAANTAFDGDLEDFATSYASGVDGKNAGAAWSEGNSVDYRVTITQKDDSTPNAHTAVESSGAHSFTWEARNN
jgi:predicted ribosomally synthesized peptide with SipW-like signal peptide